MKRENEVRELLISNAIKLVAEGGFEKATTKELAFGGGSLPDFKMNEVYIYRLFGSKEALYEHTFICLDKELIEVFRSGSRFADGFEKDTKEKLYNVFITAWNFVMTNEERCRYYARYYYSSYFKGNSQEQHKELFEMMSQRLMPVFKEKSDVFAILHSVFSAFFDFAIRVYNNELENNDENRTHIFNVLYCMLATYLKAPETEA